MVRDGAIVVVLFGGRVPYILRENELVAEYDLEKYMMGLTIEQVRDVDHLRLALRE